MQGPTAPDPPIVAVQTAELDLGRPALFWDQDIISDKRPREAVEKPGRSRGAAIRERT